MTCACRWRVPYLLEVALDLPSLGQEYAWRLRLHLPQLRRCVYKSNELLAILRRRPIFTWFNNTAEYRVMAKAVDLPSSRS